MNGESVGGPDLFDREAVATKLQALLGDRLSQGAPLVYGPAGVERRGLWLVVDNTIDPPQQTGEEADSYYGY